MNSQKAVWENIVNIGTIDVMSGWINTPSNFEEIKSNGVKTKFSDTNGQQRFNAVLPQSSSSNLLLQTSVIVSAALAGTYMIAKGYNDLQESETAQEKMLGVAAMVSGLAIAGLGIATVNYL